MSEIKTLLNRFSFDTTNEILSGDSKLTTNFINLKILLNILDNDNDIFKIFRENTTSTTNTNSYKEFKLYNKNVEGRKGYKWKIIDEYTFTLGNYSQYTNDSFFHRFGKIFMLYFKRRGFDKSNFDISSIDNPIRKRISLSYSSGYKIDKLYPSETENGHVR